MAQVKVVDPIALSEQLRDPKEWRARVPEFRPLRIAMIFFVVVGLGILVTNGFVFLVASGIVVEPDSALPDSFSEPAGLFPIFGIVGAGCLLVGVFFYVADRGGLASRTSRIYQRYLNGGYVAIPADLGAEVSVRSGENSELAPVRVLSASGQDRPEFEAVVPQLVSRIRDADAALLARMAVALEEGSGVARVSDVWPDLESENLLTDLTGGEHALLVVPSEGTGALPTLGVVKL